MLMAMTVVVMIVTMTMGDGGKRVVVAACVASVVVNAVVDAAVGVDGVAYVIANDKSISKEMICEGEAAETTFCK